MGCWNRVLVTTTLLLIAGAGLGAQQGEKRAISMRASTAPPLRTFAIIARGDSSTIERLGAIVINSEAEWRALVPALADRTDSAIWSAPADFSRESVIAIFQGHRGVGGRGIEVHSIAERTTYLVVAMTEYVPRPDCATTSRRAPYQIVVVPKTTKRVEIDTIMEFVPCG